MASDILGLFASPQQYEQQRQAAMEAQALQQARLVLWSKVSLVLLLAHSN
jgi:hypothetical protein